MLQSYSIYFKVADISCRLIIDDKALFDYFRDNYWENNRSCIPEIEIYIKKFNNKYAISSYPNKLKILLDLNKKNFLFKDVDWIVRTILQYNLIKHKIIFIHSSAIIGPQGILAFLGKSGQGKSTIKRNFPISQIISDDILVIRKKKKQFYAYQSPFEKDRIANYMDQSNIIVKKMFILVQGLELKERPISNLKTIKLLLTDNYMPKMLRINLTDYIKLARDLIITVKTTELIFPEKLLYKKFFAKYG